MRSAAVVAVVVAVSVATSAAAQRGARTESREVTVAKLGYERCPASVLAAIPQLDTTLDWRVVGKPDFTFCVPSDWRVRTVSYAGGNSYELWDGDIGAFSLVQDAAVSKRYGSGASGTTHVYNGKESGVGADIMYTPNSTSNWSQSRSARDAQSPTPRENRSGLYGMTSKDRDAAPASSGGYGFLAIWRSQDLAFDGGAKTIKGIRELTHVARTLRFHGIQAGNSP